MLPSERFSRVGCRHPSSPASPGTRRMLWWLDLQEVPDCTAFLVSSIAFYFFLLASESTKFSFRFPRSGEGNPPSGSNGVSAVPVTYLFSLFCRAYFLTFLVQWCCAEEFLLYFISFYRTVIKTLEFSRRSAVFFLAFFFASTRKDSFMLHPNVYTLLMCIFAYKFL